MMADTLEALGIPRGQYVIKVNSRKVLDGVMEAANITSDLQKLRVLRALDKLDRLGLDAVQRLLGAGRKDESGDFTEGAQLTPSQMAPLSFFLTYRPAVKTTDGLKTAVLLQDGTTELRPLDNLKTLDHAEDFLPKSSAIKSALDELRLISLFAKLGDYDQRIVIDPSVVRGLEYYTGAVFEAELLAEIPNEKGQPVVFGSVGGGGRYDGLVGRFMKENVPATGFSIGVSRLQAALAALGKLETRAGSGPVVVLVMDKARVGNYQKMVADLRGAGIAAEMYLGESGMKAQMKYADRRDAPLVVIQGGDEEAKGIVQIKDMREGKKLAEGVADHDTYREARLAQGEVPEADLVAAVARMLGRAP
jgi:histidyl-tRNA synthetase